MVNLFSISAPQDCRLLRHERRPYRVCIVAGIVESGDAVSESVILSMRAIVDLSSHMNGGLEVRLYCLSANVADPRIVVLSDWRDLLGEDFFCQADLIIHHFGIYSDIHHAINFARRNAILSVVFHGITPPHFLPKAAESLINMSFVQLGLFAQADELIVTSGYVRDELGRCGFTKPITHIEMVAINAGETDEIRNSRAPGGPLRIIYCGRLIDSKWVVQLIDAVACVADTHGAIELTLTSIRKYSDAGYVQTLRQSIRQLPKNVRVTFKFDLPSDQVASQIATSDLLVLPSLHEGFGMPVAEALSLGVPVLCSNAGALPETCGGIGRTFSAGDFEALKNELDVALAARSRGEVLTNNGLVSETEWRNLAKTFSGRFSHSSYSERWQAYVLSKQEQNERVHSDWLVASMNAYRALVPARAPVEVTSIDAQIFGEILAIKMQPAPGSQLESLRIAHNWCFGYDPSDENSQYWLGVFCDAKPKEIAAKFADLPEVRKSPVRLAVAASLLAHLAKTTQTPSRQISNSLAPDLSLIWPLLMGARSDLDFLNESYKLILGRAPDENGLLNWQKELSAGKTREMVLNALFESEEFGSRYQIPVQEDIAAYLNKILKGDLNATEFVRRMYQMLLHRMPDEGGLRHYAGIISEGSLDRRSIVIDLLHSAEFAQHFPEVDVDSICAALERPSETDTSIKVA